MSALADGDGGAPAERVASEAMPKGDSGTADTGASYLPQNILVTGGAGFIASHVVILLVEKYPQYNIVNLDRLDYCSCLENLDSVKDRPNYKVGRVCEKCVLIFFVVCRVTLHHLSRAAGWKAKSCASCADGTSAVLLRQSCCVILCAWYDRCTRRGHVPRGIVM